MMRIILYLAVLCQSNSHKLTRCTCWIQATSACGDGFGLYLFVKELLFKLWGWQAPCQLEAAFICIYVFVCLVVNIVEENFIMEKAWPNKSPLILSLCAWQHRQKALEVIRSQDIQNTYRNLSIWWYESSFLAYWENRQHAELLDREQEKNSLLSPWTHRFHSLQPTVDQKSWKQLVMHTTLHSHSPWLL